MRLLIAEDDKRVSTVLARVLASRYTVEAAATGTETLELTGTTAYDAVVLDLGLPDMEGLDVCRRMRSLGQTMPILVLTGRGATEDKVTLLDAGADDYMTKPFSIKELQARLRALTRRRGNGYSPRLEVGPLLLDTAARTITRDSRPIALSRKEFDLLEFFMLNPGRVLTRVMIGDHLWELDDAVWTNVIDVHIKHLRDKIDRPFPRPLITTVHGVGYRLEAAEVPSVPEEAVE